MSSRFFSALTLAAALALPRAGAAATVYDESVNGDAPVFAPPSVALSLGQNDILGSVTFAFIAAVPTDFDAFELVVGPGRRIVSIVLSSVLRDEGAGIFESVFWELSDPSAFSAAGTAATDVPLFASVLPLGTGSYIFRSGSLNGSIVSGQHRTADYAIDVQVAAVPLPAGMPLLAAGLGLLVLAARRRRA